MEDQTVDLAFQRVSVASSAVLALELLGTTLLESNRAVDRLVYTKLDRGEPLTDEEAKQFWYKKHANWALMRSLEQKLRAGQGAARSLGPMMDLEGGSNG